MAIDNEPRALVVDILNEIIGYIQASRPTRSDGTATSGFVYAQVRPGEMISPRAYARPWSPMSGSTAAASAPPSGAVPTEGAAAAAAATATVKRAIEAAFKTAEKFDRLLMVTDDSTMQTYGGGGRRLSFQYGAILQGMEAPAPPPRSPEDVARIEAARAVLFDSEGDDTKEYTRYKKNQAAYVRSKGEFVVAQNRALADPAQADSWPVLAGEHQLKVDEAWDKWKAQGAETVEAALATVESLGVPMEQGMIDRARRLFNAWQLNLSGDVAVKTPYVYVDPPEWAEIETDDIGWTTLIKDSSTYKRHHEQHGYSLSTGAWRGESSSTSGSAGVGLFGFGFSGSHSSSESSSSSEFANQASDGTVLTSDATDLHIELQYGVIQIARPWLTTDLFHMKNWYLRGEKAGAISDGTIVNQVGRTEPAMPMIPTHALVIRNVRVRASSWGTVQDSLKTYWGNNRSSAQAQQSATSGGVSVPCFGPFNISGGFSRSDSEYQGDFAVEGGNDMRDDYGATFDGEELVIRGAQIVALLGEIVPASPPRSDPALESDDADAPVEDAVPVPVSG